MSPDENISLLKRSAPRKTIYILTSCLALQLTGGSILFTVFARKISTFGQGVEVFGISATVFSLTALLAAPYMGMLADRFGRRRLLLGAMIAHTLASLGYLLAPTGTAFIIVRGLAGGFTAGLMPAAISMIGDLTQQTERGRWIGFVTGWSAIGFVLGPPLGGWIFDQWGLVAPFLIAAAANTLAFMIAFWFIPDTSPRAVNQIEGEIETAEGKVRPLNGRIAFWNMMPRPYNNFIMLGIISFVAVFA